MGAFFTVGLNPKQVALVIFLATFVTLIGAAVVAYWLRKRNKSAGTAAA